MLAAAVMNILNICSLFISVFLFIKGVCGVLFNQGSVLSLKIATLHCGFEAWLCTVGFVCQGIAMVVPASLTEAEACERNRFGS